MPFALIIFHIICHSRACAPERFSAQAWKRESRPVVPVKTEIQRTWIPAFAGMT